MSEWKAEWISDRVETKDLNEVRRLMLLLLDQDKSAEHVACQICRYISRQRANAVSLAGMYLFQRATANNLPDEDEYESFLSGILAELRFNS